MLGRRVVGGDFDWKKQAGVVDVGLSDGWAEEGVLNTSRKRWKKCFVRSERNRFLLLFLVSGVVVGQGSRKKTCVALKRS